MLHTINKSPTQPAAFAACLAACSPGDAVLLIEEGVYYVTDAGALRQLQARGVAIHGLAADLTARGLEPLAGSAVAAVDHAGFVALCREHSKVQSWY